MSAVILNPSAGGGRWECRTIRDLVKAATLRRYIGNMSRELKVTDSSNRSDLLQLETAGSHAHTSCSGSPALSRLHVGKVSWANMGDPCISGFTPAGKRSYKANTEMESDGCMGVGGGHSSDDGEDNITSSEQRASTLATFGQSVNDRHESFEVIHAS